jgi:hypothetical protein
VSSTYALRIQYVAAIASKAAVMAMRIIGGATSDAALELQSANRATTRSIKRS